MKRPSSRKRPGRRLSACICCLTPAATSSFCCQQRIRHPARSVHVPASRASRHASGTGRRRCPSLPPHAPRRDPPARVEIETDHAVELLLPEHIDRVEKLAGREEYEALLARQWPRWMSFRKNQVPRRPVRGSGRNLAAQRRVGFPASDRQGKQHQQADESFLSSAGDHGDLSAERHAIHQHPMHRALPRVSQPAAGRLSRRSLVRRSR
jgi:hypothetical protein